MPLVVGTIDEARRARLVSWLQMPQIRLATANHPHPRGNLSPVSYLCSLRENLPDENLIVLWADLYASAAGVEVSCDATRTAT